MDSLYMEVIQEEENPLKEDPSEQMQWEPLADVWEGETEYRIDIDLPGVLDEDLSVEIREYQLVVKGQRRFELPHGGFVPARRKRPEGEFLVSFRLSKDAQTKEIRADLKRGVLTLIIPRNSSLDLASQNITIKSE
jgi:HSP20 family protein